MRLTTAVLVAAVCAVVPAEAQKIPIRQVGPVEAVAKTKFDRYSLVRPLSDGRVIATYKRSVGILSADLKTYVGIADSSTIAKSPAYYPELPIIAGRGDTTYVVDEVARGLIVVDPTGTAGHMIAVPSSRDMSSIAFANTGTFTTYMDSKGRLVYRSARPIPDALGSSPPVMSVPADSFPLVRADLDSRVVDTLAALRIPNARRSITERDGDKVTSRTIVFVGPVVDAWTMLQDGTIAIVRGSDYHVDWIHPDGSRSSTPKMPLDWRRITDEEKARVVDSLKKIADATNARDAEMRRNSSSPLSITRIQEVAPASTIPDYFPPVRDGAARGDLDGNLWILPLTTAGAQGGLLYDVVNRKGEIFERVQLPAGCALAGFGKDRVVYITCVATSLERRRILN